MLSDRYVDRCWGHAGSRNQPREQKGTSALVETWERLQARLAYLGYLGEQLPEMAAHPGLSAWLYRVIAAEAGEVARVTRGYIAECERSGGTRHGARDGGGGAL